MPTKGGVRLDAYQPDGHPYQLVSAPTVQIATNYDATQPIPTKLKTIARKARAVPTDELDVASNFMGSGTVDEFKPIQVSTNAFNINSTSGTPRHPSQQILEAQSATNLVNNGAELVTLSNSDLLPKVNQSHQAKMPSYEEISSIWDSSNIVPDINNTAIMSSNPSAIGEALAINSTLSDGITSVRIKNKSTGTHQTLSMIPTPAQPNSAIYTGTNIDKLRGQFHSEMQQKITVDPHTEPAKYKLMKPSYMTAIKQESVNSAQNVLDNITIPNGISPNDTRIITQQPVIDGPMLKYDELREMHSGRTTDTGATVKAKKNVFKQYARPYQYKKEGKQFIHG